MSEATTFPDEFNLADYFLHDRVREGRGDHPALLFGDRRWTYAEVAERTTALRRYFQRIQLPREHRVYIVLPDMPPFAWSLFATLEHGAVVAMGNSIAPTADLENVVRYSRAAVVITTPQVADALEPVLRTNPELRAVLLVPDVATGEDPEAETEPALATLRAEARMGRAVDRAVRGDRAIRGPTRRCARRSSR